MLTQGCLSNATAVRIHGLLSHSAFHDCCVGANTFPPCCCIVRVRVGVATYGTGRTDASATVLSFKASVIMGTAINVCPVAGCTRIEGKEIVSKHVRLLAASE